MVLLVRYHVVRRLTSGRNCGNPARISRPAAAVATMFAVEPQKRYAAASATKRRHAGFRMKSVFRPLSLAAFLLSPAASLIAQDARPPAISAQAVQLDDAVEPFVLVQLLDASTGSPVHGAQVFLLGTEVGDLTNMWGSVVLPVPEPGRYTVGVRLIPFCPAQLDLEISPGTATQVLVALQPDPVQREPVKLAPPLYPEEFEPETPLSGCGPSARPPR